MAQLNHELAERELLKKFRHENSWIGELKPKNNWVNNDVIKIPRRGAAPTVLINNQVYPIQSARREDDFIAVSLNKYDTTNTIVTDDELYALAYEKLSDVQVQHREELEDKTAEHALHAVSVAKHAAGTPILKTTGPDDGTGRRRLITKDLIDLWKKLGDLSVPLAGRILVLSTEHAADLLLEDSAREKSWGSITGGLLTPNHVGFKLYTVVYSPSYKDEAGVMTKQAFGATVAGAKQASICFFNKNVVKATGSVKRYATLAENDTKNRQNELGFRLWFGAFVLDDAGCAGIVSADVPEE